MWSTLALVAAAGLALGQSQALRLTNIRSTYGIQGITRPGTTLLPGDRLVLTFHIEGMSVDETGKAQYSMATEVRDGQGKVRFGQEPRPLEAIAALGGTTLPAYVQLDVGLDQAPGEYTVQVTVTDRTAQRSQSLSRKFQVLPRAFGLVRLTTTGDPEAPISRPIFTAGESAWVNGNIVGFARDKNGGHPHVSVELRVLDEKGKPTLARSFQGEIKEDVPSGALSLPVHFLLALNRPGKFTVQLKATDRAAQKTAELSFPLTVLPAP
ncbi:MAG: hypothetical protein L0Z62_11315 [Gemmataceae bacterium]|nr:hypothetical protein [Gemmataceae bacterium]MCI0457549.1 hypothetical protein [Gemmataceae bacterium]